MSREPGDGVCEITVCTGWAALLLQVDGLQISTKALTSGWVPAKLVRTLQVTPPWVGKTHSATAESLSLALVKCNHVLFWCLAWRAINRACVQCCKPVCVQGCRGLGQLPAWSRGKDGQQMRGATLRQDILVTDCLSAALLWLLSKGSCCTVFTVCFVAFPALRVLQSCFFH